MSYRSFVVSGRRITIIADYKPFFTDNNSTSTGFSYVGLIRPMQMFILLNFMQKRTKAIVILTILTALWGTTFSIVQNAMHDVSPVLFAAIRFFLSLGIFL